MNNWIWHQKFDADEATYVGSYYNITHTPELKPLFESKPKFVPELNGVFKRDESQPIGFKINEATI